MTVIMDSVYVYVVNGGSTESISTGLYVWLMLWLVGFYVWLLVEHGAEAILNLRETAEKLRERLTHVKGYQSRVHDFIVECFGHKVAFDRKERGLRFIEEAIELVQAVGITEHQIDTTVNHVYGRPVGEIDLEIGAVMVTLASLSAVTGDGNMSDLGEKELARILPLKEKLQKRWADKPNKLKSVNK